MNMRSTSIVLLIVLGFASIAVRGQGSVAGCITLGFDAGGAIVTGRIAKADLNGANPTVSLQVSESLRGTLAAGSSVDVPVDWVPAPGKHWALRPPVWARVSPDPGKRVLILFLHDDPGQ